MKTWLTTLHQVIRQVGVTRVAACMFWFSAENAAHRAVDVLDRIGRHLNRFASHAYRRGQALDIPEDEFTEAP